MDGNMTRYLRRPEMKEYTLTWDGENRLIAVETLNPVNGDKKVVNTFDGQSRRVRKQVYAWAGSWTLEKDTSFVFDDWNVAAEYDNLNSGALTKSYTWGLDLSGSIQGAGGVGGLLAMKDAGTGFRYRFTFDANGNVSEMIDDNGSVVAHYEYDPFGNTTQATGIMAQINPWRFSTKPVDESGMSYYGYRFYSAELGRWINRDPIGEKGGINLMGFVRNNPVQYVDRDGRIIPAILAVLAIAAMEIVKRLHVCDKLKCGECVLTVTPLSMLAHLSGVLDAAAIAGSGGAVKFYIRVCKDKNAECSFDLVYVSLTDGA